MLSTHIFLISKLSMLMHPMISGNSATMSLLLMVILATIFFKAIFLPKKFLSFFVAGWRSSARSSATLPCCARCHSKLLYAIGALEE